METNDERRLRKLRKLCDERGGVDIVAATSGLSPAALGQVVKGTLLGAKKDGARSPKQLGDESARKIEAAYKLGRGWFDNDEAPESVETLPSDARTLASEFNAVQGAGRGPLFAALQNMIQMARAMDDAAAESQPKPAPALRRDKAKAES